MNFKYLFVVIVVLIFVSSCGGGGDIRATENYRTGSDGIVMNFLQRTPDKFYTSTSESQFAIEVRNSGAFPQRNEDQIEGKICVGGFDPAIIGITADRGGGGGDDCVELNKQLLEGKSSVNMRGGYTTQMFRVQPKDLPSGLPSYTTNLIISASYNYKTHASPIVCIDTKPYEYRESRVCEVGDYSSISPGTQGAPVAVSRVEEEAFSEGLLFRIYVRNVGGGTVIPYNDLSISGTKNPQNKKFDWNDIDYVTLESASLAGQELTDCNPKDVRLINGEGQVFCKYSARGENRVYKSPLNIVLRYGYLSTISKEIEVIRQPGMGEGGTGGGTGPSTGGEIIPSRDPYPGDIAYVGRETYTYSNMGWLDEDGNYASNQDEIWDYWEYGD